MPYLKFDDPKSFADNKGSCSTFINYLSKEDYSEGLTKEFFFNHLEPRVPDYEITQIIDGNKKGLGLNDQKFYTGSINLSEKELEFIGNDSKKIQDYTIKVMEQYASQFNRSVTIEDINWYAKIEHSRSYKGDDAAVTSGLHNQGDKKEGLQTHVHFIIGRKSKDGKRKLSPKTNHRSTSTGPIKGGFDRDSFKQESEAIFDRMFGYLRPIEESYKFLNTMKNGDLDSKVGYVTKTTSNRTQQQAYHRLGRVEKEDRIRKLANFICFGGKGKGVKTIDVDSLLQNEMKSSYSGHIYRSLMNLNENIKAGRTPAEYDLTETVLKYANFLKQETPIFEGHETTKMVALEPENSPTSSENNWHRSLDVLVTNFSDDSQVESEEVRKRKKKRHDYGQSM